LRRACFFLEGELNMENEFIELARLVGQMIGDRWLARDASDSESAGPRSSNAPLNSPPPTHASDFEEDETLDAIEDTTT
jgi:hypothetical protein